MSVKKPIYLNSSGVLARLEDGAIINAGGVQNPSGTFTVNGRGLLFDDGSSSGGGSALTLQNLYENSNPAAIHLSTGKDLTIYDDTSTNIFFRIDAETGKVTITGDLEVLGQTITINTTIQDVDHWLISPSSAFTPALRIEPDTSGSPFQANLVEVRNVNGGAPVFTIDRNGDVAISGLINGIHLGQFHTNFINHTTTSAAPKHTAAEINVEGPFTNIGSPPNVQQALVALDALVVKRQTLDVPVAATVWTMTHPFNTTDVIIQVTDTNGYVILAETIQIVDSSTVQVTFGAPQAGKLCAIFL